MQKENKILVSVVSPSIRPEGLKSLQECLQRQTFKSFEWLTEVGLPNKSDLNAALNRMARRAKGECLIFLQDFLTIPDDGLAKFYNAWKFKDAFYTASVNFDWRNEKIGECTWLEWEIDWGACGREALIKIGGFDETLDQYWGFDNVNAGLRADMAGYKVISIKNPAIAVWHPEAPMKKNRNPEYHNLRLDEIRRGLKIDYLTNICTEK